MEIDKDDNVTFGQQVSTTVQYFSLLLTCDADQTHRSSFLVG
eukprot:SAG31_NODE_3060_length_4732_cov_2.919706_3_plen_42_part_00